jgi:predicted transposase/invertase (TIGR01784 family)
MTHLIRFDWAVKKLLRDKANFDVLEGFLSELLKFDVQVQEILESESNKQSLEDKFNRVDILVRTKEGELMLVEVQNDPEIDYFHRILYGVSKLATAYIKEGAGYGTIQKIISISIVYFRLGQGKDYVYEYKGEFIGKYKHDTLRPNTWQKGKYKVEEIADILPKYYILKINNFNKIAEDTLEQWIYFLKYSELPTNCTAKGLKAAGEKLRVDSLSAKDRKEYEKFVENRWIEKNVAETAIEGKVREITKNLLQLNATNEFITKATGLSDEQIENVRKEMNEE